MDSKKQLGRNIMALLLFVAFMLPSAVQIVHMFEGHENVVCTEQSTHIHKAKTECEICDSQLTIFDFEFAVYPDLIVPLIPSKIEVDLTSLQLHSFTVTNTQLRAPPVFS